MSAPQITDLNPGTEAVLVAIEGDRQLVERLGEIGFVQGETILFHRRLVFNGPLILEVRGVPVALRAEEACCLHVRVTRT
jgi:Fe2+ transport system protein FeoA